MKKHIPAITLMRGMGVLGVIGIHVGGIYLENPKANLFLLALYDEVSRYAVPIFFFLSAFGLFYKLDLKQKFDYLSMLRRRLKVILIPYIAWSVFYLYHTSYYYNAPFPYDKLGEILLFGLAKYHIYFLVILIWFYILMPLWIFMVKNLSKTKLILLLAFQIIINYFFCYSSDLYLFQTSLEEGSVLWLLLAHRLNYCVIFYFFIFLLGAYLAQRFDEFLSFLKENYKTISVFFFSTMFLQAGHFFYLVYNGRTPIEAIYTAHQLSPLGIFYTIASCLFFFYLFTYRVNSGILYDFIETLGKHSYFIYLAHPIFLTVATVAVTTRMMIVTSTVSIMMYCFALFMSLFFGIIFKKIAEKLPILGIIVLGK